MEFNLDQLRELIAILNQTDISELTLESGDLRLNIRKSETKSVIVESTAPVVTTSQPISATVATVPAAASTPPVSSPLEASPARKLIDITSPMVGTFYSAPAPDEPPFVEVGDRVSKGQTVCIIEAMKLMNEIESEASGRIVEILVDNAQPIEYGQLLMRVDPS
ncbi:acetyl-CoA carboxylase biotin carboxyl carrier protein [Pseudanabaena sp. PCC 6802]|uniref:acetyl-CoA carboxylase biotin carboxyl carrier protein n=1 Tax=Pseudanabaena sp. PCC 6802 TaxID=118173 RepID=UPI000349928F|nr:acetyl-CoA carboxylase biotin carboxyl carrier protein [Pseudanabaena sp. PCC 6802]